MAKRTGLSKRIRFEVFKRDKFTCQYCGAKSPAVVLNVDHLDPVANGGDNSVINLITSCFDCNSGKSDRLLQDSSLVEKQRKQLELLQERREQIELMLEWKKSLSEFDNDIQGMIAEYIDSKMIPWSLTASGKNAIGEWLKKFDVEQILDAVDTSAKKYLKHDENGATTESADQFIGKIGGILYIKNLPPIEQKLAYIKGIARNRFNYWDDRKGSIILSNYLKAIKQHYDDSQILNDLESEVTKITKECSNWTQWRDTIEGWTSDIENNWIKPNVKEEQNSFTNKVYKDEEIESFVAYSDYEQESHIKAVEHMASIFPEFDARSFRILLNVQLLDFVTNQNDLDNGIDDHEQAREFVSDYVSNTALSKVFSDYDYNISDQLGVCMALEPRIYETLTDIFMYLYFPTRSLNREYLKRMMAMHIEILESRAEELK